MTFPLVGRWSYPICKIRIPEPSLDHVLEEKWINIPTTRQETLEVFEDRALPGIYQALSDIIGYFRRFTCIGHYRVFIKHYRVFYLFYDIIEQALFLLKLDNLST